MAGKNNVKRRRSNKRGIPSEPSERTGLTERSAGILLAVSSLPSPFGIGDIGPSARAFVDFCKRSGQRFWQVLPMGPVTSTQSYSPYSALSGMAGNVFLISPESMVKDGLLGRSRVKSFELPPAVKVNHKKAHSTKEALLDEAYATFLTGKFPALRKHFESFCDDEAHWLNDYAMYELLKLEHNARPWNEWKNQYKLRDPAALKSFASAHKGNLQRVKWRQFIFWKQWSELRRYAHQKSVKLMGDLPIYMAYDSSDVWAHRNLFALDRKGDMTKVAGVPPDYFNRNGQLWGMPVFRWENLKKRNYDWWVKRITKNLELFDLVRIDHFRAFSAYWEVPSGELTAKNGKWKKGPGADFFAALQQEFAKLPLVAEDLGDIDEPVRELRAQFGLPGMKVLQFAFGDTMPSSEYIPHNYETNFVVYTGTHDNNTTRGWYKHELRAKERRNIRRYLGAHINDQNIHIELGKLAYSSVAKLAILPLQDVLGLDEQSRMNTPATTKNNWLWRFRPAMLTARVEERLLNWAKLYNRY